MRRIRFEDVPQATPPYLMAPGWLRTADAPPPPPLRLDADEQIVSIETITDPHGFAIVRVWVVKQ